MRQNYQNLTGNIMSNSHTFVFCTLINIVITQYDALRSWLCISKCTNIHPEQIGTPFYPGTNTQIMFNFKLCFFQQVTDTRTQGLSINNVSMILASPDPSPPLVSQCQNWTDPSPPLVSRQNFAHKNMPIKVTDFY